MNALEDKGYKEFEKVVKTIYEEIKVRILCIIDWQLKFQSLLSRGLASDVLIKRSSNRRQSIGSALCTDSRPPVDAYFLSCKM